MSNAFEYLRTYVESTTETDAAVARAREDAAEFGLPAPDEMTGQLLTTLAATTNGNGSTGAIAITPAAGLVGLYILNGLADNTTLTCIDPESEHQRQAKALFREAGYSPSRVRFLLSRPLDVMSRLANDSYQLVFGQVSPMDLKALVDSRLKHFFDEAVRWCSPMRSLTAPLRIKPARIVTPKQHVTPMNIFVPLKAHTLLACPLVQA